ncbi:beta-lactamase [Novosphingobium nitrogenifigens DSM 19370]|uniref:Beta-lactamase n=1 Tax=Novosphingobium nitrogenifigens DSM 19370 TaxID=983920 RepID=F1Z5Z8_9SPHN|nr:serine hydrolase domain-containing protein [Novosphingobium nitrogenifigens]EGD59962.1 beta-lactamase [Novosphingobium nitrogenifigens DSM 19370]
MKRLLSSFAALALVAQPLAAVAQVLTAQEEKAIDEAVTKTLARTGVPSVSIAVVRGGELVMTRAWGRASDTLPVARPDIPYQIASNSKQFLAALLLLLADEGKLSLDDTVAKWLPEVSGADHMSVRQLLSHTSGLQDYWPQDYAFAAMATPTTPEAIIDRWAKKPLDYDPGSRWQYSNTGYVVAGRIAEKAGGAPLAQLLDERLFHPLGIHPLFIDDTNGPAFPKGYARAALGPVRQVTPPARGWLYAAGELSMTAADLARWDIARLDRRILPARDWAEQETPVRLSDGTSNGYGLGVSVRQVDGRKTIDHGGESIGFLSQNTVWPDDRAALVVLTNAGFSDATSVLTEAIGAVILPRAVQANTGESARTDDARAELAALAAGRFNPAHFTDDARSYFTPQTLTDYRRSLTALGACTGFAPKNKPRLRGGFVNRNFTVTCGKRSLTVITYAERGDKGRWEQLLVSPD